MINVKTLVVAYARSLWRRRWYGVAVAWLVCLAGWAFVMQLPNVYQGRTRIYVDTDTILLPLLRGIAAGSDVVSQVDLMQRTLLSTPNLQKVSHAADLDLKATTPAQSEQIVADLRRSISVSSEGRNLFSLSYTGASREVAFKVVQSLLQIFTESQMGNSRTDMQSARTFIDDQIRDYERQLEQAEQRVAEFKTKNAGFLPGESNYFARLDAAKQQLDKTQAELNEARQRRDAMAKQLAAIPQTVDTYNVGPPLGGAYPGASGRASGGSDLVAAAEAANARVMELQKRLDALQDNYTDQHPDVINVKRLLDQAKKDAAEARQALRQQAARSSRGSPAADPNAARSTAPNPVYEQLELQLVAAEGSIASLEERLTHDKAEVEKWTKLAAYVPEVAAQMTKLNRDYEIIKRQYDQLVSRRESAKLGSEMEEKTPTMQFRIIDPPEAPTKPVAPNRPLLLSLVLLAGIGAGGAFAFLLSQTDDSILDVRQLKDMLAVPILGAISLVADTSRGRRSAMGTVGFVTLCLALVGAYVGIISIATFGTLTI